MSDWVWIIFLFVVVPYLHLKDEEEKSRENQRQIRTAMRAARDAQRMCPTPDGTN